MRMRKIVGTLLCIFLTVVVCLSSFVPVAAETIDSADTTQLPQTTGLPRYTSGDYIYCEGQGDTVVIVGHTGEVSGTLEIPATLDGYPVVSIAQEAFRDCKELTGVVLPDGLLKIGFQAFYRCEKLESVRIPDSVISIEGNAFLNCTALKEITFPAGLTELGYGVVEGTAYFEDASHWENSVFYINQFLVAAKETLSGTYEIKEGTTAISDWAFADCDNLTEIVMPDTVSTIGSHVFSNCPALATITVSAGVLEVGEQSFSDTLYYNTASNWEGSMLYLGHVLLDVKEEPQVEQGEGDSVTNPYVIKDGTRAIADGAFSFCTALTEIVIPEGVTRLGKYTFTNCTKMTKITLPSTLEEIGYGAFNMCSALQEIQYNGTQEEWNAIVKGTGNDAIARVQLTVTETQTDAPTDVPNSDGASDGVGGAGDVSDDGVDAVAAPSWTQEIVAFAALAILFALCMMGFSALRKWKG